MQSKLAQLLIVILAAQIVITSEHITCASEISPSKAGQALIRRIVPNKAHLFQVEAIPKEDGRGVFEIESCNGKIVIRGSSGVAIASGWNWYLKYYCRCQVSLWGNRLKLPEPLPCVSQKVRRTSRFKYRYYLNFCAFSYSLAWYDWAQWERLIDWMALHGVNMPLAVTGEESVWYKVYRNLGLNDKQIADFFVGPGYLPFGWMGCFDGFGGPLPKSWIESHRQLQHKILARERALGMTPVLQGFTGHVPVSLKNAIPDAKLQRLPSWNGFPPTYFIDPQDQLFVRIGKMFIEEQTREFGTDHLYASDTFIEMRPPSNDPAFLATMSKSIHEAMRAADPKAVWVMQGWIFSNAPDFWKPAQTKALLGAVADDRMILLDLACENMPVWSKTEAFYGKPWIWSVIQDYGDVVSLHGGLPQMSADLHEAMTTAKGGNLVGIGMVNEGLGTNPVVNDFIGEMAWRKDVPKLDDWEREYVAARYGDCPPCANEAWRLLLATVYKVPTDLCRGSVVCSYPSWASWEKIKAEGKAVANPCPYDLAKLALAWQKLLSCSDELGDADTYRFDLVHVGRQVLAELAFEFDYQAFDAYQRKDRKTLDEASNRFLQLIRDMDELTATRKELLLGKWLGDAKRWANNDAERQLYEWNARTILTVWGPSGAMIRDYANKQWSGMLSGFYLPRWKRFFQLVDTALADGKPLDMHACQVDICAWEVQWTHQRETYLDSPSGDAVEVSRRLLKKYGKYFDQ